MNLTNHQFLKKILEARTLESLEEIHNLLHSLSLIETGTHKLKERMPHSWPKVMKISAPHPNDQRNLSQILCVLSLSSLIYQMEFTMAPTATPKV